MHTTRLMTMFGLLALAAIVPSVSAGTVADEATCPSSTGPRDGLLVAGTLCVADPTNGASLQSLGPVATVLENVDQTYQIWTDGADFFDAGDSGPGECGGPNGVPSGAVWTLSDPINGIVIACTPADSPFFGEVARLASAV